MQKIYKNKTINDFDIRFRNESSSWKQYLDAEHYSIYGFFLSLIERERLFWQKVFPTLNRYQLLGLQKKMSKQTMSKHVLD